MSLIARVGIDFYEIGPFTGHLSTTFAARHYLGTEWLAYLDSGTLRIADWIG